MKLPLAGLLFFALVALGAHAQPNDTDRVVIRFSLLGPIDFLDNNFTPGVEYKLNGRWSVGLDAGYIFASNYISESKRTSGVLLRPFVRLYPNGSGGFFLQGELHYKRARYAIQDWVGRAPVNGIPSYEEYTTFGYIKRVIGAQCRVGRQFILSRDDRLKLEFSIGLGVRFKKSYVKDGVYAINDFFNFRNVDPNRGLPAIPLAFHLCYQLK